jgi:hypothetical protein
MSSGRHRGHGGERFIVLPHWLLRSGAWCALSPNAKAVLIHLWERHNGSNNGQIVYAVREAEAIGISKSPTARALVELVHKGFLRITRSSAFTVKTKEARCWAITAEPVNGERATKDFMRWSPEKIKTRSPRRDRQSPSGDRNLENAIILSVSVPQAGPSTVKSSLPQSPSGDTSNIPWGKAADPRIGPDVVPSSVTGRRPLRHGDIAFAERTRRHAPRVAGRLVDEP